jgi:hypothetical protein
MLRIIPSLNILRCFMERGALNTAISFVKFMKQKHAKDRLCGLSLPNMIACITASANLLPFFKCTITYLLINTWVSVNFCKNVFLCYAVFEPTASVV